MMVMATVSGKKPIRLLRAPVLHKDTEKKDLHLLLEDDSGVRLDLLIEEPIEWVEQLIKLVNIESAKYKVQSA